MCSLGITYPNSRSNAVPPNCCKGYPNEYGKARCDDESLSFVSLSLSIGVLVKSPQSKRDVVVAVAEFSCCILDLICPASAITDT